MMGKKMLITTISFLFLLGTVGLLSSQLEKEVSDATFSLGITDNSGGTHNGNNLLKLDFDGTPDATTIVPVKVASGDITIDGREDDWANIEGSTVPLSPKSGSNGIDSAILKAAYDEDFIYFLLKWMDPTSTENTHKKMWTYSDGTWKQSGNEDRVYFLWNINATDFEGNGCIIYCHGASMGTNNPTETVDVWHWKAARTDPVGIADDKHWVDKTVAAYDAEYDEYRTRLGDSGSGTAKENKSGDLPASMAPGDPGANAAFLYADSAVPFDANAAWKDGDTIPGYILKPGEGSRADVQTKGVYADGVWTVEFKRLLDTGNPDDHSFLSEEKPPTPAEKDYTNVFFMALQSGLNMISLPLEPIKQYTARKLAEELGATVVIKLDAKRSRFVGFTVDSADDGFAIEGGKGYIVNVQDAKTVAFTGAAWTNQPPAAAPTNVRNFAWAFVVSGTLIDERRPWGAAPTTVGEGYTVIAKNLRTGAVAIDTVSSKNGGFAAVWADLNRKSVVEIGDRIQIIATDTVGKIVSGPMVKEIGVDDIQLAYTRVALRVGDVIPERSMLAQNYPNPFNPETWIPYQLAKAADNATVKIFDAKGQLVRTFYLGHKDAGIYMSKDRAAYWNGKNNAGESVANGVYFYQLQAGSFVETRKMLLLK